MQRWTGMFALLWQCQCRKAVEETIAWRWLVRQWLLWVFLPGLAEMAVKSCQLPHFDGQEGGQMWWWTLRERTVGIVGEKKRRLCFGNCKNQWLVICEKCERTTFQEKPEMLNGRKSCKKFPVKSWITHFRGGNFLEKKASGCQLLCVYCCLQNGSYVCVWRHRWLIKVWQMDADDATALRMPKSAGHARWVARCQWLWPNALGTLPEAVQNGIWQG